jgi:hypothetical protein
MSAAAACACAPGLGTLPTAARASGETPTDGRPPMSVKPSAAARRGAFDPQQLAALLPAALGAWKLESLYRPQRTPIPEALPDWRAEYIDGTRKATLELLTEVTQSPPVGSRSVQHERREDYNLNVATLPLSNGLTIVASSHGADAPALAALIHSIDLARAEKLVRSTK